MLQCHYFFLINQINSYGKKLNDRMFELHTKPASELCEHILTLPTPTAKGSKVACDAIIYIPFDEKISKFPLIFFN